MFDTSALDAGFLAKALGRPVTSVAWRRVGADRGFASVVLVVTLEPATPEPASVAMKVSASGADDADLAREVVFYREVAPAVATPAPRAWYAGRAPSGKPVVVLDDLSAARPGDQLAGASGEEVAAAVRALLPMWRTGAARVPQGALPVWRPSNDEIARRVARYREQWAAVRTDLADRLPPELCRVSEALGPALGDVLRELAAGPAAVVHGDLHLDNVLFPAAGAPVVLDWARAEVAPLSSDVFPFLASALRPDEQRDRAPALVAEVSAELPADARRRFVADGRRALARYVAGIVGWLARPPSGNAREAALRAAALADGRVAEAVRLWDVESVLSRTT